MRLRYLTVPLAGAAVVLGGVLAFGDLNGNLVYYLTPTEAVADQADFRDGRRFRLAGLVESGSLTEAADEVSFVMTDGRTDVRVGHRGVPPQLFQEGIQVVVEGAWHGEEFRSDTMLVKHDETYYPPEDDVAVEASP